MQRLTIADRLMDWRVEPIEHPKLELIGAFEKVLEVGKREHDIRHASRRFGSQALARGVVLAFPLEILGNEDVFPKLRDPLKKLVARHGRPGQVKEFLTAGHSDIEKPSLVLDSSLE